MTALGPVIAFEAGLNSPASCTGTRHIEVSSIQHRCALTHCQG